MTEALLIAAARRQNIAEVIKPNLSTGKIIIREHYADAYFAFQGFARGLPQDFLEHINSGITGGIEPDLTILLDLDPKIALSRLKASQMHRIEKEPLEFHKKVRQGYIEHAKRFPKRIKIIDANRSVKEVFSTVWNIVKNLLVSSGVIKC